jgi:antitoxin (DNA-binding transcriptional repressor) of toxin-antitoxin stability system
MNCFKTRANIIAMTSLPLQQVQAQLPELIHRLAPGDEVVITENDQPVARIVPPLPVQSSRKFGSLRGTVLYMAADFDEPLAEFREYMEECVLSNDSGLDAYGVDRLR